MEQFFSNALLFGEMTLNSLHLPGGRCLDMTMSTLSFMGGQLFFFIVLPILFWCYDSKKAAKIGGIFLISAIINAMIKSIFNNPRPDPAQLLPEIRELYLLYSPRTPGFPSGHTQNSLVFWGSGMYYFRNRYLSALGIIMVILIPYSRIYLGVHYLGDVLGGYVLGVLILIILIPAVPVIEKNYGRIHNLTWIIFANSLPWLVYLFFRETFLLKTTGILAGLCTGIILGLERIEFQTRDTIIPNLIKIFIGFAGMAAVYYSFKLMPFFSLKGFISNWILGLWISFFAPLIFSKIRLVKETASVNQ